ncbi:MAG: hypothetical protein JO061_22245, partial [Acidobacteriaceae bacterium]|nr:hypothetical protein [Acidobacteriaceae bacterium]
KSGAAGSGISVSGSVTAASGKSSATETVTAFTSATCCASSGGLPVTVSNPAQANEVITLLATGLGTIQDSSANYIGVTAGVPYSGPQPNSSQNLVIATVQGGTAQVISAGLPAGGVGTYQIQVLMPSSLPSSGVADIYVAQNAFFSNTVTLPVGSAGTSPINIFIDVPNGSGQYERGVLNAAGWAIDNNASISQVAVWLDGTPYVNNATRVARPDVCRAYPSAQDCANGKVNVGWAATINTANLTGGTHSLAVIVSASDGTVDSRMTTFTLVNPMRLYIDSPVNGSTVSGTIPLGGWAISNGGTVPTSNIAVFVDGVPINGVVGVARPDVCAAFPSAQDCANGNVNVGWAASLDTTLLANGSHTLTLRATDSNSVNAAIAATFTVNNAAPSNMQIYIDNPGNPTGTLVGTATLQGWAFSTVAAVSSVNLSVDGVRVGTAATNPRPDVCAAHANAFGCPAAQLGWHLPLDTTKLANGTHQLEVTATAGGQSETITSSFSVANWTTTTSVHVFIDTPNYQNTYSGVISAEGWAVSDQAAITSVAISVDGVQLGNASLGVARPDVCAAYPGRNGCPNVGWVLQFDSTLLNDGSHSLMATATDANGELATLNMTFTVANTGSPIQMFVDTNLGQALSGTAQIEGWAGSSSSPVTAVTLSVDGFQRATTTPGIGRPDVCGVYPNLIGCPSGTNLGWIASLDTTVLAPGPHVLDVTAKTANGNHTISRNFTVSSAGSAVRGYIDRPTQNATLVGVVQISGWSTNSGNPSSVVISIDGMPYPQLTVSYIARPDVCAAFGYTGTCPNVGWSVLFDTRQLGDGAHTLSATGTSGGQTGTVSTTINVANFTNTSPIQIGIDPLSSNGAPVAGILTLSGYAFSNSGSVSQVSIAIDGVPQLSPVTYGVPRTDVCNGGNGAPGCPDVGWQTTLDTTLLPDGTHTLDVTATVYLFEPHFLQPVSATMSTTFTVQNLGGA